MLFALPDLACEGRLADNRGASRGRSWDVSVNEVKGP